MSLSDEADKRELCPAHGWVGRAAFQRDRHDLCEAPVERRFVEEEDEEDREEEEEEEQPSRPPKRARRLEEHEDLLADDDEEEEDEQADDDESASSKRGSREGPRRRGIPSKKTIAVRRITKLELAAGKAELRALGADAPYWRPKTRGDCAQVPRPCPYVACKQNMFLDVSDTGSIILNFPHLEPGQMVAEESCALDLTERGPMTLEDIAVVTNLTRERIRQIELKALVRRARPAAVALGLGADDAADLVEAGIEGDLPSDIATILAGAGAKK